MSTPNKKARCDSGETDTPLAVRTNEKKSVGEQIISQYLDELNVAYEFDRDCEASGVKNGSLRFDFCIPKSGDPGLRNSIIIEYNGIFHYHTISGKTSIYTLTKQQMNDYIKQQFAYENNIPILWIPYWMQIRDVKKLIHEYLVDNDIIQNPLTLPTENVSLPTSG
tara:strand:+ start:250 stop:747 length:498 start_codon:yes stop_codon:yes gene_type:complete